MRTPLLSTVTDAAIAGLVAVAILLFLLPPIFQIIYIFQVPLVAGFCTAALLLAEKTVTDRRQAVIGAGLMIVLLSIGSALFFLVFSPSGSSDPAYDALKPPELWATIAVHFVLIGLVSVGIGGVIRPRYHTILYGLIGLGVAMALLTLDTVISAYIEFERPPFLVLLVPAVVPLVPGYLAAHAARKQPPRLKFRAALAQGIIAALIAGIAFSGLMSTSMLGVDCGGYLDNLNCVFSQVFGSFQIYVFMLLYLIPSLITGAIAGSLGAKRR